jgi:hypothetical protein
MTCWVLNPALPLSSKSCPGSSQVKRSVKHVLVPFAYRGCLAFWDTQVDASRVESMDPTFLLNIYRTAVRAAGG